MEINKIQLLVDDINKTYWAACANDDSKLFYKTSLMARQLIMVLGQLGIVHDKLLDNNYPNKYTLEKE